MATWVCRIMGAAFLIIALLGFMDGRQVFIFHVNTTHNVVHLLSGALALWVGFTSERASRMFSAVFGAGYGLVALLGFAGVERIIDLLRLNAADNWLHLAIAAVFLVAAIVSAGAQMPRRPAPPTTPPTPAAPAM